MKIRCRICGDYECADADRCRQALAGPDAYALTHPSENPIVCPHCGEELSASVSFSTSNERTNTGEMQARLELRLLHSDQSWIASLVVRDDSGNSAARFNETMARRALDQLARAILEHLLGDRLRDVFRHLSEQENEETA